MRAPAERLWEVDVVRTLAIVMMATYHVGWDLDYLVPGIPIDPFSGGWRALQVATGSLFLFVVGVSLAISEGRSRARGVGARAAYLRHVRRAVEVLAAGLLVTVVTLVALGPEDAVRFGILQCIGVSMLIVPLARPLGPAAALLGVGAIVAGLAIDGLDGPTAWLMPIGLVPQSAELGVDYYPLLPWIGPVLIGLSAGLALYPAGRRGRLTAWLSVEPRGARAAGALGRHALPVYLVHQPVLIALLVVGLVMAGVHVDL